MSVTYNNVGNVTIPEKKYNILVEKCLFLDALQEAGVDNWEGYSYACELVDSSRNIKQK